MPSACSFPRGSGLKSHGSQSRGASSGAPCGNGSPPERAPLETVTRSLAIGHPRNCDLCREPCPLDHRSRREEEEKSETRGGLLFSDADWKSLDSRAARTCRVAAIARVFDTRLRAAAMCQNRAATRSLSVRKAKESS